MTIFQGKKVDNLTDNRSLKETITMAWKLQMNGIKCLFAVLMLTLLGGISFVGQATANGGEELWPQAFQDVQTGLQEARASVVDSSSNLIITGYSDVSGNGNDNIYTLKISSDGQTVIWSAVFDLNGGSDWGEMIALDGNGNVIVTGYGFNGISDDIITVAYDGLTGNQLWVNVYNDSSNANDYPNGMALDANGNIFVAGYSQSGGIYGDEALLVKLDPLTITSQTTPPVWVKSVNITSGGNDRFTDIAVGVSGIAVTGYTTKTDHGGGADDYDCLTELYDDNGTLLWQETYDHGYGSDEGRYIGLDVGGAVIVSGKALAAGHQEDIITLKYPATGGIHSWLVTHSAGSPNIPVGLVVGPDGDAYLAGYTFTNTGLDDYYVARYAGTDGQVVWDRVYDSGTNSNDSAEAIALDADGGVFVTGFTDNGQLDSDFLTVKFNGANGNLLWSSIHGSAGGGNEQTVGVAVGLGVSADGHVYAAGWTQDPVLTDDLDYYAVKYDSGFLSRPTDLSSTLVSENEVNLIWQDNSNNVDPNKNEDNFCVQRCSGYGCDFSSIDFTDCSVPANTTLYKDLTVTQDTWYSYRVYGQNTTYGPTFPSNTILELTTLVSYVAPLWQYIYDGAGLDDVANAIAMGPDDNPVATGMSAGLSSQDDYYTVKFDRADPLIPKWVAIYDGVDGQGDKGICLDVDGNGGVVVSGFSSLPNTLGINTNDIFTIKYDSAGPAPFTGYPLWTDQYNGPGNDSDRSEAIATAADGTNFSAVVGYGKNLNATGNDDIYLIKYKPDYDGGSQQVWAITPYDSGYNDYPASLIFDSTGDVIVVGKSYNANGDTDIFINKYDGDNGTQITGQNWPFTYDYNGGDDGVNAVAVDSQGNVYVAGFVSSAAGDIDWYINKFDGAGNPLWGPAGKVFDGGLNGFDTGQAVAIDINDGDVVLAGTITNISGTLDFHVKRFSSTGVLLWEKSLDRADHEDTLEAMAISLAGDICLVGDTDTGTAKDIVAVKYDNTGEILGATLFDNGFEDHATAITVNKRGEFFIAGSSETGPLASDDKDFLVFKFEGDRLQAPSPLLVTPHYTTVDLSWTANDPNVDYYTLQRKSGVCTPGGTDFSGQNSIEVIGSAALFNGISFSDDTGVGTAGSTFCYGLQAKTSSSSIGSRIIEKEVITNIPTAPVIISAIALNSSDIEVCWRDNTSNETFFGVERCSGASCDFTGSTVVFNAAGMPDDISLSSCFIDTTACDTSVAKTYRYRVNAFNNQASGWSSPYSASSSDVAAQSLGQPVNLLVTRVTDLEVDLQWNDAAIDETEFAIERCEDISGNGSGCSNFVQVGSVAAISGNILLLEMDESAWSGMAGEVLDYSGQNNSATSMAGALISSDSHAGNSGSFDGIDDYLATSLLIDQSSASPGVTMMAWVKPASLSVGEHYLFSTENGLAGQENSNWGLLRNGNTWAISNGSAIYDTGILVDDKNWHHLAVTFSVSGTKLYLDGVESSSPTIVYWDSPGTVTLGRQGDLAKNYFDGLIDEAAVYARPLTSVEINKIIGRGIFPESTALRWFTDTTVNVSRVYNYQIRARKSIVCGTGSDDSLPSNTLAVETIPASLTTLQADLLDPGQVYLSWTPTTMSHTAYQVERCNGTGCTDFVIVDSTVLSDALSFLDTTFCFGSDGVVRYQIKTLGSWGETLPGNIVEVSISTLAAPLDLSFTRITESKVNLTWRAEDSSRDGFRVLRCQGVACTPALDVAGYDVNKFAGSSLMGLWKMDEIAWDDNITTLDVVDSSGNGNHGNAFGQIVVTPDSRLGSGAALFDGVDDYINTGVTVDQSLTTTGVTFEAWVYPVRDGLDRYNYVMSTSKSTNDYDLGIMFYSKYDYWYVETGISRAAIVNPRISYDTWQHLVFVYDLNGIKFYINGVEVLSTNNIGVDISDSLVFGREGVSGGNYFTGKMDNVAVYNRVLTPQEISDLYNSGGTPIRTINFKDSDNITSGSTYTYRVLPHKQTICNDYDNFSGYLDGNVTAVDPLPPADLNCVADDTTTVTCNWTPSTDSETNFRLERCLGTSCSYALLDDTIPAGSGVYTDAALCENSQYSYRLRAEKTGDLSWPTPWTADVVVSTLAAVAPALNLTVISESEIDISWIDSNIDEESIALSYCEGNSTYCGTPANYSQLFTKPGTDESMLLRYKMDDADFTLGVKDASNYGNDAVASDGVLSVVSDKTGFGGAAYFDGAYDYISTPVKVDQSSSSLGATFEMWVKPDTSDISWHCVISSDNYGKDWGILYYNGFWYVSTGNAWMSTGIAVDGDQWQHIAAVFIPGTGIKFYKNGAEVLIPYIDFDLFTNEIYLGEAPNSNYKYRGFMDEVAVYNRPLSAAEILDHMNNKIDPLSYKHIGLNHSSHYFYNFDLDKTVAGGCDWHVESSANATTPAPPPPTVLNIVCDTTSCALDWHDNNGSETAYIVERCDGSLATCGTSVVTLQPDSELFQDDELTAGSTYTYSVYATGSWGTTTSAVLTVQTDPVPATPAVTVQRLSEVEIDQAWTYSPADETGLKLERCLGASCSEITLSVGTMSYSDNELTPGSEYCYRLALYKTTAGTNSWQTPWSSAVCSSTDNAVISDLSALPVDTTSIALTWHSDSKTESNTVIERCTGSLASCSDPDFVQVGAVLSDRGQYVDAITPLPADCYNRQYSYRVKEVDEGLSNSGGGCWSERAPIVFSSFTPFAAVRVDIDNTTVNFPEMQADFSDIRFYDATAQRELPVYWIKVKVIGDYATVWFLTGANDNIYIYYGNGAALPAGTTSEAFTELYDDFQGTVIDHSKWTEIDLNISSAPEDTITQSDGLNFRRVYNRSWTHALISTETFERAVDNEIYIDFSTGENNTTNTNFMVLGWGMDQETDPNVTKVMHGLYMQGTNFNWYLKVYENGLLQTPPALSYTPNTRYIMKVVLQSAGAQYYIKGGTITDWTLVYETNTTYTGDQILRIGLFNYGTNAVIHSVKVMHASELGGATIGQAEAPAGGGCWSFTNLWQSGYSNIATAATFNIRTPVNLQLSAVNSGLTELTWDDNNTDETGYLVERCCGTGCTYSEIALTGADVRQYTDSSMPESLNCDYRISAYKDGSCPWISPVVTTPQSIATPAPMPLNFTATPINAFQIDLAWDDVLGEDGYLLEMQIFNGKWVPVTTLGADINQYIDTSGINPGTSYHYRLCSLRTGARSSYIETVTTTDTQFYDGNTTTCTGPNP